MDLSRVPRTRRTRSPTAWPTTWSGWSPTRCCPTSSPGRSASNCPPRRPPGPEPMERILEDYARLIEPNITHWQHPGSWPTSPAWPRARASSASGWPPGSTPTSCSGATRRPRRSWRSWSSSWLRQMLGLPDEFDGMFTDTASVSSLLSLVAARHAVPGLDSRGEGLAGREGIGRLRMYVSTEAHSSIEKAAIVIGVGQAGVRRIPADESFRMRPGPAGAGDRRGSRSRAGCRSAWWRPWGRPRPPAWTRPGRWPTSAGARGSGCTSMRPTPAPRRCCPRCGRCSTVGSGPIRSCSTRTSGCSRRSTHRCSCSAARRLSATRSAWCRST